MKPALVPFFPPQIPHELTWDRTLATAVGAMVRPRGFILASCHFLTPWDGVLKKLIDNQNVVSHYTDSGPKFVLYKFRKHETVLLTNIIK
jgi:hypothetical protein